MKCPVCGEPSIVVDEKDGANATFERKRQCVRNHKFVTYEFHSLCFSPRHHRVKTYAKTLAARVAIRERNMLMVAEKHKGVAYLQQKFKLTRSGVFYALRDGKRALAEMPNVRRNKLSDREDDEDSA